MKYLKTKIKLWIEHFFLNEGEGLTERMGEKLKEWVKN